MNKTVAKNCEYFQKELDNYSSHVKFPRDIITITTKAVNGPYVRKEAETFSALRLPHVKLTGYSHKTHIRFIKLSTGDTHHLRIDKIARITDLSGKDITPGPAKTSWKIKDYDITFNPTTGKYTCTCKGFQFRKKCKHIQEVKNERK